MLSLESLKLSTVPSNDELVCDLISNFSLIFSIEHYVNFTYQHYRIYQTVCKSFFLVQWCYFVVCDMKESGQNGKRGKQNKLTEKDARSQRRHRGEES